MKAKKELIITYPDVQSYASNITFIVNPNPVAKLTLINDKAELCVSFYIEMKTDCSDL